MVIINLYPVAAGGGLQNALSFLTELKQGRNTFKFFIMVRQNSELHFFCEENKLNYFSFEGGLVGRLKYELYGFFKRTRALKPSVIFTLFGSAPIVRPKSKVVCGFARSNIIESEVKFWGFLPFRQRLIKSIKDKIILLAMRNADVLILETRRLVRISKESNIFGDSIIELVEMAPSSLIINSLKKIQDFKAVGGFSTNHKYRILYLSGAHKNKNIHKLPFIFKELEALGLDVTLVTTMPSSTYLDEVLTIFDNYSLKCENIGPIEQDKIPSIIEGCSAIINVAELESFSNNWVEAWASRRLLICKNSGYARESCHDAAIYVDFEDVQKSAKKIKEALVDNKVYQRLIKNGEAQLASLPNSQMKFKLYEKIIEKNLR